MVRVGVIGTGYMGSNHVRAYSHIENAELVAVADVDIGKAAFVGKRFHCKYCDSIEKLLKENLDAISVAVPSSLHYEIAKQIIDAGVNLLVEKPITLRVDHAKELINKAKNNGVKLTVGHIERFNPAVLKLKEVLENGSLGEIDVISSRRLKMKQVMTDSGVILQSGIHDLDIINNFIMKIKSIRAFQKLRGVNEDYCFAFFELERGIGFAEFSWRFPRDTRKLTVIGEKGTAELDFVTQGLKLYPGITQRAVIPKIDKGEPLMIELRHFVDCVENDKEPLVTGEDGLNALKLALLTKKSAETGKIIPV